ncbi:MAG: 4Fe-4S dicluster domain-containing protein [Desulfosarcinaceae bacterium]
MKRYYLFQDTRKCIGCRACEVQCKSNKNLPVGPRLCQIIEVGPKLIGGLPRTAFIFMPCFHCENPWCVAACPTGAMQQRSEDGIVTVDHNLCVGCKTCISACPWGTPQWDPEIGKVVKCDFCVDRLDQGLKPACVTSCTTQCLEFGLTENMNNVRRRRHAESIAALEHSGF